MHYAKRTGKTSDAAAGSETGPRAAEQPAAPTDESGEEVEQLTRR